MLGERTEFPVSQMARVLEVSRSGFCSWLASGCPRDGWSAERDAVMRVWLESDRHFRFRFVHAILPPESSRLARYRALKSMRKLGIRGCTPNARKHATIPGPMAGPRPDLMRRDFSNPVPAYKLVSDSPTCAPTGGWLYLVTVVDLHTRMVVGWSLSDRMTTDIAVAALESAKSRGYVVENAIFHSDRDAQYKQDFGRVGARQRTMCAFPAAAPATATTTPCRVVLRHGEERDVLPQALPDPRRRQARRHRVRRDRPQPQAAPFDHRLQGAGAGYGVVLRAHEARIRASSHGCLVPRTYVSENSTQVTGLVLAGHRVSEGLLIAVHKSEVDRALQRLYRIAAIGHREPLLVDELVDLLIV